MDLTCYLNVEIGSGDLNVFNLPAGRDAGEKYLRMLNILFANTKKCLRALDNVFHFPLETWFMPRSDCNVFESSDTVPLLATQGSLPLINAIKSDQNCRPTQMKNDIKTSRGTENEQERRVALHKPTTRRMRKTNQATGHKDKRFITFQLGSISAYFSVLGKNIMRGDGKNNFHLDIGLFIRLSRCNWAHFVFV